MVGQHHQFNGYEFEQTPGDDGWRIWACCSPQGCKELDTSQTRLNDRTTAKQEGCWSCLLPAHESHHVLSSPALSSVTLCQHLEIGHSGDTYTLEIGKQRDQGFLNRQLAVKYLPAHQSYRNHPLNFKDISLHQIASVHKLLIPQRGHRSIWINDKMSIVYKMVPKVTMIFSSHTNLMYINNKEEVLPKEA